MPILDDVFKQFPNIPINLDIKAENTELMEKVKYHIAVYEIKEQNKGPRT